MGPRNRATLKNYFIKGSIPREEDFHDLIDSTINTVDDGLVKEKGEAIRIREEGRNGELINFFKNLNDPSPVWLINQRTEDNTEGFNIAEPEGSRLFIKSGGNVGIGITNPLHKLEVDGTVGMKGRMGYFAFGEIPADGKWHNLIANLNHYSAFEVMAVVGMKGAHGITHAIAVSAYGNSNGAINKTQGYYGRATNKIDLQWSGEYFDYQLQARTRRNYGAGSTIKYNITKLWE